VVICRIDIVRWAGDALARAARSPLQSRVRCCLLEWSIKLRILHGQPIRYRSFINNQATVILAKLDAMEDQLQVCPFGLP